MEKKRKCCCRSKGQTPAPDIYPGASVNQADNKKVDKKLVKERTATLNNNPRNNDL